MPAVEGRGPTERRAPTILWLRESKPVTEPDAENCRIEVGFPDVSGSRLCFEGRVKVSDGCDERPATPAEPDVETQNGADAEVLLGAEPLALPGSRLDHEAVVGNVGQQGSDIEIEATVRYQVDVQRGVYRSDPDVGIRTDDREFRSVRPTGTTETESTTEPKA